MPGRKMFPNSVVPLPSTPGLTTQGLIVSAAEPKHRADMMQLHFSLAPPEALQQELEDRVAKGEVIPIDEQEKKYGADAASADVLAAWLKSEGFKVSHVTPDHTSIYASAPMSQVEASLGVHAVRASRVARDDRQYCRAETPCGDDALALFPRSTRGPSAGVGGAGGQWRGDPDRQPGSAGQRHDAIRKHLSTRHLTISLSSESMSVS